MDTINVIKLIAGLYFLGIMILTGYYNKNLHIRLF